MKKSYEKHMEKKKMLAGKRIVGIDPAKEKHQATVLDEEGMQRGKSFSFSVSHDKCIHLLFAMGCPASSRRLPSWCPIHSPLMGDIFS